MKRKDIFTIQLGQLISRKVKNGSLKIELSEDYWYSSKINVYAIPNLDNQGGNIDIIISPFPPNSWKNIYALKVIPIQKFDSPGFITSFTDILRDNNINILKLQSNPTFAIEPYSFWLLLDLTKSPILTDIDSQISNCSPNLEDEYHYYYRKELIEQQLQTILAELIEIAEARGTQFLYNFVHKTEKNYKVYWDEMSGTENIRFDIENYQGVIPRFVLDKSELKRDEIQYSIISNPNQKTFFILRIFGDEPVIYLGIQNIDVIGSINEISKAISRNKGNVLSATALIEKAIHGKSHYFTLISINSNDVKNMLNDLSQIDDVQKIIIYNYSENIKSIGFSSLMTNSKIEILKKGPFAQKFIDSYKVFKEKNYFSLDVIIRVFFEKAIEVAIFTFILSSLVKLNIGNYLKDFFQNTIYYFKEFFYK
ncbi:hypothetical protein [Emticicia sp. BO119]|uniref:hypothetical protein n=1 Tax=Emticicia sp. BO119 TaxID=2757768 RepID=UPI0015F06892|nr:hypothetical protein [Emticicia sp. BO119]MBA4851342.1 hypothetical protein [Emticicia sp. BO119]